MGVGALAAVVAKFYVFLSVVPCAARGRHHDGQHEPGANRADEHSTQGFNAQNEPGGQRGRHRHQAGHNHFLERALGGDVHAFFVVRFGCPLHQPGNLPELAADLIHDRHRRPAHGLHGEGGEQEGQHGAGEGANDHRVVQEVDLFDLGRYGERRQQRQRGQRGRANGETLAGGRSGVAQCVKRVSALSDFGIKLCLLGDTAGVVSHGAVGVGGQRDSQCGQEADPGQSHAVETGQFEGDDDGETHRDQRNHRADHARSDSGDHHRCRAGLR